MYYVILTLYLFIRKNRAKLDQLFTEETFPSITSRSDTSTRSIRDSSRRRPRRAGTGTLTCRGSTVTCRSRPGGRSTRGRWHDLRGPRGRATTRTEARGRGPGTQAPRPRDEAILLPSTSDTMDPRQVCRVLTASQQNKVDISLIHHFSGGSYPPRGYPHNPAMMQMMYRQQAMIYNRGPPPPGQPRPRPPPPQK